MSRFSDLTPKQDKPQGKVVEFYADCQHCNEEVSEVTYFPNEGAMVYTCSQGHKSILENVWIPL